jgi:hypothetical protein
MSRFFVMAGLDPAIHRATVLGWMAWSSPAMTNWAIPATMKRKTD